MGQNEKMATRPDENRPRSPQITHEEALARHPQAVHHLGDLHGTDDRGLMSGGTFAMAGLAAFHECVVGAGAACMLVAVLFPPAQAAAPYS